MRTQIVPYLDSFDDELLLQSHLEGLVGTDSKAAKSFVRDFVRSRFPAPQLPTRSHDGTKFANDPTVEADRAGAGSVRRKGKKTLAERAGIGQTLPPRQVDQHIDQLSTQFGSLSSNHAPGTRDEEALYAGFGNSRKGKETNRSRNQSTDRGSAMSSPARPRSPAMPVHAAAASDTPSTSQQTTTQKPPPPPTVEMLAIDSVLEELTSTSSVSANGSQTMMQKKCFCQGRKHVLAPYAPLCYSCGMILCSAIVPSPLSPLSSCPSCAAAPLLSAPSRADLLSKLSDERQTLYEQQLAQIQALRELKKANKGLATSEDRQSGLFPVLGNQMALAPMGSVSHQQPAHVPVFGKHGALKKAQAIANDAQRTAKVLSLDPKTRKVTQARPKSRPAPSVKSDSPAPPVESKVPNDPYLGLDGTPLVRNKCDDGFAPEHHATRQKGSVVQAHDYGAFQTREWLLKGEKVLVQI